MGLMKEVAMQQRLEEEQYVQEGPFVPLEEMISSNILCPNCTSEYLTPKSSTELDCTLCGHEFELIDTNTVKFK